MYHLIVDIYCLKIRKQLSFTQMIWMARHPRRIWMVATRKQLGFAEDCQALADGQVMKY